MNLKEILGAIATVIALISYIPYIRDILSDKTKPHVFTWLIWGTLTLIGFLGQLSGNAGPGAWPSGLTTILCFLIFVLALKKGSKNIVALDVLMLLGAIASLFLWFFVKQPTLAIILVVMTDAMGFVPTVRKSWHKPQEETLSAFVLSAIKHFISLFAIRSYSLITTLYPAYLVIANILFISLLVSRRKALITSQTSG
ncbi:MAG: hypothetical protein UX04_C0002G0222 [Microgenomates group bacterium GW2011_GWF2_45_18]|nr:MAG: hypothetical protein UW18_C0003G0340 [Microgenomates group bacterium GW2011_GWF1_44_10]KKU02079.1 MAG: hypothetical protein UX04_C0002G0222 [Microgenomates group bacterium GW2011_GWF2_45_18]HAU98632.1 hypothetical protein [Candidatus Paceibacterota bacterium]HAX01497.1 hypothetical protein [Candidatus Paceibacterota bacterium]